MSEHTKVINFQLKNRPTRDHALNWLLSNISSFPNMDKSQIGEDLFHGWRFIKSTDKSVYFANCIDRGISENDFYEHCFCGQNHKERLYIAQ